MSVSRKSRKSPKGRKSVNACADETAVGTVALARPEVPREASNDGQGKSASSGGAPDLVGLNNVRRRNVKNENSKSCLFLCGSMSFVTKDPVEPDKRDCIRWKDDLKESVTSEGKGTCDYWCYRTFVEDATELLSRDAKVFQQMLAKDKDKLTDLLCRRGKLILRYKARGSAGGYDKRSGTRLFFVNSMCRS
jgi:hypothetical protein